jgi:hypothetical protein
VLVLEVAKVVAMLHLQLDAQLVLVTLLGLCLW